MAQTDREDQMHHVQITDDVPASRATYLAVAQAKGCHPLDLPPLARTIDPDGLDALVGTSTDADSVTSTFEYAGCSVTVDRDGVRVTVR